MSEEENSPVSNEAEEAEAAAKKKAKAEEEAAKKKAEEEEEAAKKKAEAEEAEAAAKKKAEEEEEAAKKKAEAEEAKAVAKKKAKEEEAKEKEDIQKKKKQKREIRYCKSTAKMMIKVLEAIKFKGGSSSIPSLKVALMLDEIEIRNGGETGEILGFLEKVDEDHYKTTYLVDQFISSSTTEKMNLVGNQLLEIEAYRDIIFKAKMSDNNEMSLKEISKAIYILLSDTREEIRKDLMASFLDIAIYANIVERTRNVGKPGIRLTNNGEDHLNEVVAAIKRRKKGGKSSTKKSTAGIEADLECSSCGKPIRSHYNLCPYCGTKLKISCSNCGKELQVGWKACPFCGTPN